jgi:hypothetical protein
MTVKEGMPTESGEYSSARLGDFACIGVASADCFWIPHPESPVRFHPPKGGRCARTPSGHKRYL